MARKFLAGLACVLCAMGSARAETLERDEIITACRADYFAFCAGVIPGGGRIIRCLSENAAALQPECRMLVMLGEVCLPDIKRLCGHVPPSNGQLAECIEKSASRAGPDCSKALQLFEARREGLR